MKICTFRLPDDPLDRVGVVRGDEIADISASWTNLRDGLSDPGWAAVARELSRNASRIDITRAEFRPPIPHPGTYAAIGLNTRDHRRDISLRFLWREKALVRIGAGYLIAHPRMRHAVFFSKSTSSIVGAGAPIVLPPGRSTVDWEGELAVIIGQSMFDVDVRRAQRGIAGYTIANDISVRGRQLDNPTSTALAKSYPTHGPLGPWVIAARDFSPADAIVRTFLNGELRQQGNVADLVRSPAEVVSELSRFTMLRPGDVVACGTFAGTGWPVGRFLSPGDDISVEITGIGRLSNSVLSHDDGKHLLGDVPQHVSAGSSRTVTDGREPV